MVGFLMRRIHGLILKRNVQLDLVELFDIIVGILGLGYFIIDNRINELTSMQSSKISIGADLKDNLQQYTYVLTVLLFFLFLKFFQFLSRTEKLGVFIKIIYLSIRQMSSFLLLFMLNIFSFGSLFYLLSSYRLPAFSTFLLSLRTLVATSLGTLDFSGMNIGESIIQVAFIYSSNVIMINLLIAILSETYSQITDRSNVEFALILYEEYRRNKLDQNYSLLIAFPPPLNLFSLVLMPFLLFQKRYDFNNMLLKIGYTLLLLGVFPLFLLFNLLCVPFTWIFLTFSIIRNQLETISIVRMNRYRSSSVHSQKRVMVVPYVILLWRVVCWLVLGLPYLLYHSLITDSSTFFKSSYVKVNNKYQFKNKILHSYPPHLVSYLLNKHSHLVHPTFKNTLVNGHCKFLRRYLLVKTLCKQPPKIQNHLSNNSFFNSLKTLLIRSNLTLKFNRLFDKELQKCEEQLADLFLNKPKDETNLAILRTKQIFLSTEFWQKNKVTSHRQAKFFRLVINPSNKRQISQII